MRLKGGNCLINLGHTEHTIALLMDRAYEGDKTRALAISLGYDPVVHPKKNRVDPWEYDKELYKKRNEVERFFRRYKAYRRICTRSEPPKRINAHSTISIACTGFFKNNTVSVYNAYNQDIKPYLAVN